MVCIVVMVGVDGFRAQSGMGKKTQGAQPVIDSHNNHALLDQTLGIVVVAFSYHQGAAVNPKHHRMTAGVIAVSVPIIVVVAGGSKDIEKKTILSRAG